MFILIYLSTEPKLFWNFNWKNEVVKRLVFEIVINYY